jgi:hypothetical protein
VSAPVKRGLADLEELPPETKLRKPDPLTATEAAVERALATPGETSAQWFTRKMQNLIAGVMGQREAAPAPATAPPPPHVPLPPGAPRPPELKYDARVGWHIPSTLSREQLAKMHAWARSDRSR